MASPDGPLSEKHRGSHPDAEPRESDLGRSQDSRRTHRLGIDIGETCVGKYMARYRQWFSNYVTPFRGIPHRATICRTVIASSGTTSPSRSRTWHQGSASATTGSLATRPRRTRDRDNSARVSGSCDRFNRNLATPERGRCDRSALFGSTGISDRHPRMSRTRDVPIDFSIFGYNFDRIHDRVVWTGTKESRSLP